MRLRAFQVDVTEGQLGVRNSSFREFKAYGALGFFGAKDRIASRQWIADLENAHRRSFCSEGDEGGIYILSFEGLIP